MARSHEPKQPHRHAHGPLVTNNEEFERPRSKKVRDRIRRWAKRVLRERAKVESRDE